MKTYLGSTSDDAYDATHEPDSSGSEPTEPDDATWALFVACAEWADWRIGQADADSLDEPERALLSAVERAFRPASQGVSFIHYAEKKP